MKSILIAAMAVVMFQASAWAAASAPASSPASTGPDPNANPVLASIQKAGAKVFYMGNRMGMDGWFIVKNGQVQIVYSTPNNKGALIGALFGEDGENISTLQVQTLVQNNKELADLIDNAAKEQQAIMLAGNPAMAAANEAAAKAANAPATMAGMPTAPLSPGERLMHDLSSSATILVGNPSSPELLMVMDTHCPHCQATWKVLRDAVFKGSIHIRMIPIGVPDSDSERTAAILLGVSDPLNMWDKYVGGDQVLLAGTPSMAAVAAIRANHAVIDTWSIQDTPYMVYRAKDGKVKVVVGEPSKVSAILNDIGS